MQADTAFSRIPETIRAAIAQADPSWQSHLIAGAQKMAEVTPAYWPSLINDRFLPKADRLFAAFSQPMEAVRYVLVGEGPYPREASATGYCFIDGAVDELWSEAGLSKQVNRATSLRNFLKMLMVAEGLLPPTQTTGRAVAEVARLAREEGSSLVSTLRNVHDNLHRQGFLLLNATLVYRAHVAPTGESRAWQPFFEAVLSAMAERTRRTPLPTLVLWGKVAERLAAMPVVSRFPLAVSEHPYNVSFIHNRQMQDLFGPMRLLRQNEPSRQFVRQTTGDIA